MIWLLLVSLLWAFSFGLIKLHLVGLEASLVAALRMSLSLVVFAPLLRLRGVSPRLALQLMAIGALQFGVMYVAYIESYRFLRGYEVALLTVFTPLWMTLLHGSLARRWALRLQLAALLAIAGALVILWDERGRGPALAGALLLQLANLAFAAGQLLYRRTRARHPELADHRVFALLYAGAFLLTWALAFGRGDPLAATITPLQWLVLLHLGVVASGLGFFLWNLGATRVGVGTLAVMNNGYVPFAVLASVVLFGESVELERLLPGSALLVLALWLAPGLRAPLSGTRRPARSPS